MVKHKVTTFITDTSLVVNKNGSDNPQLTKHKSTKISVISDDKGDATNSIKLDKC
jgi:hypothetical protein